MNHEGTALRRPSRAGIFLFLMGDSPGNAREKNSQVRTVGVRSAPG